MKTSGKLCWGHPANPRVRSEGVVKALNVSENSVSGLISSTEVGEMHQLTFQATKKVLSDSIVIWIAPAAHALGNVKILELFPVGM